MKNDLSKNDILNNVIDELNRAIEYFKIDISNIDEIALTDVEILINDMETSVERLYALLTN